MELGQSIYTVAANFMIYMQTYQVLVGDQCHNIQIAGWSFLRCPSLRTVLCCDARSYVAARVREGFGAFTEGSL